jgi:outer membrane receptor protein involved in Fe transport
VLVLIDGVQVNSVTLGAFDFANLTPEGFDRVEVLRGGGGSLYGSEAVGGVINLITRSGSAPPSGGFSVAGGNGATDRETGVFSAATDLFKIAGTAKHLGAAGFGAEGPVDAAGAVTRNNHAYDATTFRCAVTTPDRDQLAVRHPALREERRRPRQREQLPRRARSERARTATSTSPRSAGRTRRARPVPPLLRRVREGRRALQRSRRREQPRGDALAHPVEIIRAMRRRTTPGSGRWRRAASSTRANRPTCSRSRAPPTRRR